MRESKSWIFTTFGWILIKVYQLPVFLISCPAPVGHGHCNHATIKPLSTVSSCDERKPIWLSSSILSLGLWPANVLQSRNDLTVLWYEVNVTGQRGVLSFLQLFFPHFLPAGPTITTRPTTTHALPHPAHIQHKHIKHFLALSLKHGIQKGDYAAMP